MNVTPDSTSSLARRMAGSAVALVGEFGVITLLSAINTVAITRLLGAGGYGVYGTAVAASAVLGAVADFGFGLMLSRDAGEEHSRYRPMLRAAYTVACWWSLALAGAMVALALSAPIASQRGLCLVVLAPSMAFNGLNPAKVFFVVLSRTGRLVRIELACTALQVAASIAVAAAGLGPIAVCAAVSAGSILDNVLVAAAAERMLPAGAGHFSRRALVARSLPLGALSVMTRVYLTIDLVLLGAYISGPRLGDYAAASKLLTVLAGLAGAVMTAALPTLSSRAAAGEQLQALVGRVWHWLVVGALPVFAALGLFAPLLVRLSIGPDYAHAVPLVRILSIAGAITVLSNLVGNLQVALHRMRALFIQNAAAIVLNVSANLVLIPRDGVYAAAWITVATEALVCSAALLSLRRDISYARLLALSLRPLAAVAAGATVGLLLIGSQALGLLAASGVFLLALCVLRAWPIELPLPGWLVLRAGSR